MSIYRGAGGAGDAVADSASEALLIRDLAVEVQADADAAAASATTASTQATNASNSASTASTQASNASTSATNASNSASSASTSATNASNSASTATTQASNASTSATAAASSATSASGSASTATTQATNASTSASTATTQATNASNSASAASTSASNASTSASNAATSATNAANSATTAASYTPSQTGNSGKFLTTNGTSTSWGTVDALPSQTGNSGKYLTTNGTASSWDAIDISTADVTGTLTIAKGGTGAATRQEAMDALAGAVTSGQYLRGNGTDVVMSAIQSADVPTLNQSTTGSAATLTTSRTIAITGDLTYTSPSFNGSANVTAAGTLATVNSNTGSFGSATSIPVVTVNGKGLITAVSTATVAGGQYFGSASTKAIAYNSTSIAENITTTSGNNCLSVGPITISSGYAVTIASGQRWVIL